MRRETTQAHFFISNSLILMELTPFTLEEAEEIREDFEDLVDTEFKIGTSPLMFVENVRVAPLDDADKNSFVESYYQSKDSDAAMGAYSGPGYDVVLITCEADDETNFSFIDIRTFADLRGIKYDFPVHD